MQTDMGKIIQQQRKLKGMTQEQLAQLLGVSSAAVSKWETGNALPDVALLCPLARALDCTANELLDFKPQLTAEEISTLCTAARRLFEAGEEQKAEALCEARLREYPGDLQLAFRVGGLYTQYAAQPEKRNTRGLRAAQLLEQATALPDEELARTIWQLLAGLYLKQQNYEKAWQALAHLPSCNPQGRSLKAAVLRQKGELAAAAALDAEHLLVSLADSAEALHSLAETQALLQNEALARQLQELEVQLQALAEKMRTLL